MAIIGGSGIADSPAVQNNVWKEIDTGLGKVEYQEGEGFVFIPRHGHKVKYGPHCTQYAANLVAARMLGARWVIGTSAVGTYYPDKFPVKSLVVPTGGIDESWRNPNIWGKGLTVHTQPRPLFSEALRTILLDCAKEYEDKFEKICDGGRYVTIPGDNFGTADEGIKRAPYSDIVGMTLFPEVLMAFQLGIKYACVAFPVDADFDATHGNTKKVMGELSQPEIVPAYITQVVGAVREHASQNQPYFEQLKDNLIPDDLLRIENPVLRAIAKDLLKDYGPK